MERRALMQIATLQDEVYRINNAKNPQARGHSLHLKLNLLTDNRDSMLCATLIILTQRVF